jgi:serine/threonine-protein kinase
MDDRPRRRRLIPAWLLPSVLGILLVLVGGGLLARANYVASLVSVPDFSGRPLDVAEDSARLSGLSIEVLGDQFSADVDKGSVLSQDRAADSRVRRGTTIGVVLSAGTETVRMPDVVGLSLEEARDRLRDLGLGVTTQDVVSAATASTVLESFPSAGADVRTGTTVRLSIAIGGPSGDSLLPYDLTGLVVALDPSPVSEGSTDLALDVSRRIRSLLEASGATVSVTRSVTGTMPTDAERVALLAASSPDVTLGLSLSTPGTAGVTALAVRSTETSITSASESLARSFTTSMRLPGQNINPYHTGADGVLGKVLAPGMRVWLGDPSSADDRSRFADPNWADSVARAVYRALGETFRGQ